MSFTSYTQYYNSLIEPNNYYYYSLGAASRTFRGIWSDFLGGQLLPSGNTASNPTVQGTLNKNSVGAIPIPTINNTNNNLYVCGAEMGLTAISGYVMLCDRLLQIPLSGSIITTQVIPSISLPRYTTGDGVLMFLENMTANAGVRYFSLTYTNSEGVSGRTGQGSIGGDLGTNRLGVLVNLSSGDTGVRSVETFTMGSAFSIVGQTLCLSLIKPIAIFSPTGVINSQQSSIMNFINGNMGGGIPSIDPDSCLFILRMETDAVSYQATGGFNIGSLIIKET